MRTRSWLRTAVFAALGAGLAIPGFTSPGIGPAQAFAAPPENWEARARLQETIFAPVRDAAAHARALIDQLSGAVRVSFQPQTQSGDLYLLFVNQQGTAYPFPGPGAFVIKRSLKDGSFLQAKVFVQNDPGCYVRLFPQGDRTAMDIYLFDEPFQSQILLPVRFERLLTAPFARIMELSASSVDWPLVLAASPGPGDQRIARIVSVIRSRLGSLRDMDDGAMDRNGRMVYIATGAPAGAGGFNCSGFAKWIVDGFYAPLTGKNTDIAELKSRNANRLNTWSSRYEEELDPYFGLDWSRGLARSISEARTGVVPPDEQIDVREASRVPYVKDAGFPVPKLRFLLYFLARADPGTIYIGSVNAPSVSAVQEGTPTLRQHHHLIVLFPYFDARGAFQVVVMERNLETSLASLARRYGSEYVHLVRLDSTGEFSLPQIE